MSYTKTNWQNLPSTSTPINATNLNKIENQLDVLSNVEQITSNEFFDSITSGITIREFYAFKVGNILNIQRVYISGVSPINTEVEVGIIKEKYRPCGGKTIRWIANGGGMATLAFSYINGSSGSLEMVNTQTTQDNGVYADNITYICNG